MTPAFPLSPRNAVLPLIFGLTLSAAAATINVGPGQSIQTAIQNANSGDVVLVAPGTYTENIDFLGKSITVTSTLSTDPATIATAQATTIIDGGGKAPTVLFQTGEGDQSILSNLTIRNGGATTVGGAPLYGGIVVINDGSPLIEDNLITANTCAGISTQTAAPTIQGNTITATQTLSTGCGLTNGSAIYIDGDVDGSFFGVPTRTPVAIIGNTITGNVETKNVAPTQAGGAAIAVISGGPYIVNNAIHDNAAPTAEGGAIDILGGFATTIVQNLIYNNSAGCGGGAIAFNSGALLGTGTEAKGFDYINYLLIANNTIVNNTGPASAASGCRTDAQFDAVPDGTSFPGITFVNNIVSGNSSAPALDCSQQTTPSLYNQPVFDHNLLFNAGGAFFGPNCVDASTLPLFGNIVADPLFADAPADNFTLSRSSPAINAGNNSVLEQLQLDGGLGAVFVDFPTNPSPTYSDFAGNMRFQDARIPGVPAVGYPIIDIGAYEFGGVADGPATQLVLPPVSYSITVGPETLTAHLTSEVASCLPLSCASVSTGNVDFFLDGNSVGTAPVIAGSNGIGVDGGVASQIFELPFGVHTLTASYLDSAGQFSPGQSIAVVINVSKVPTTTTIISATPPEAALGAPITFTIQTSAGTQFAPNSFVPTPVVLTDASNNNAVLATVPIVNGTGTVSISTLASGTHDIVATYAGDDTYEASSDQTSVIITGASSVTVTSTANPASAFLPFTLIAQVQAQSSATAQSALARPSPSIATAPTGSVVFYANGKDISSVNSLSLTGTAQLTVTLPADTYSITATYSGDTRYTGSTSSPFIETVAPDPTATSLTAPTLAYANGPPVTLTAAVQATPNPITVSPIAGILPPTGTITIADTNGPSFTQPVTGTANGAAAMFQPATFALGMHVLTATYSGDNNYLASTSAPVTLNVMLQDFTLTAATPSITIQSGHGKDLSATLTSLGDFAGPVKLTCSGLPLYATCNFANSQPSLAAGATLNVSVDIETDAFPGFLSSLTPRSGQRSGIALALLLPLTLFAARRRRIRNLGLFAAALALIAVSTLTGCTGKYPGQSAPGTYTFTITGTATGTVSTLTHSIPVTLIVTQ